MTHNDARPLIKGLPNLQNVQGCRMQEERVRREKALSSEWLDRWRKAGDGALTEEMLKHFLKQGHATPPPPDELSANDWQKRPRESRPAEYLHNEQPARHQHMCAASARLAAAKAPPGHWHPTSGDYGNATAQSLSARAAGGELTTGSLAPPPPTPTHPPTYPKQQHPTHPVLARAWRSLRAGARTPKGTPMVPAGGERTAASYRMHGLNGLSSVDYALTQACALTAA